jgi:hypothetical protein
MTFEMIVAQEAANFYSELDLIRAFDKICRKPKKNNAHLEFEAQMIF